MVKLLADAQQTLDFGRRIAAQSDKLHIIYLNGVLGAGKTTLTRGILQGLGYSGNVKSPTYTLVETYVLGARTVHHFDLYRVHDIHELEDIGFRDYFTQDTLCLIEWPDKATHLPPADLVCDLEVVGSERKIILRANTPAGMQVIEEVKQ
ncbi:MAG: tRNA (adenosine(37)-N6)-threonylcarbamoyltransferase complex ATPase subunit type 1 TsaE [Legionellales bacterium]|jgi:tRNA threonylcarbamoyladenosine biosynthesis protein TsaE